MKVTFFHRKPRGLGNFSIEYIFEDVRNKLSDLITADVMISRYESSGLLKRLYNIFEASFRQGKVNHITGDVHFLAILMRGKNTVLTVHDCVFMKNSSGLARWILKTFWLTLPVKKCGLITAVSEATKQDILKYVNCNPDKIKVIPVAIAPHFKPSPKSFNQEKPVLLQVGLAENKNLFRLAEAIKGIPCHLSIVGKPSEEHFKKLDECNIEYSYAHNISDEEMYRKYVECDILTFVSTYEGFGMPIIEANSVERAVLTSNVASMPEVAGDAACLIDPYDVESIRAGLLKIIRDSEYRNLIIENGRKNKKRFSSESIAKMYYQLYEEIHQS